MSIRLTMNALIKIFIFIVYLRNIKSDCVIEYINDADKAPKFQNIMGKFKMNIPFRENDEHHYVKFKDGQTVQGYCNTSFSPVTYEVEVEEGASNNWSRTLYRTLLNQTALVIDCRSGTLFYEDYQLIEQIFSCIEPTWAMYSSKTPYDWCENNQNSSTFLLAIRVRENNVLAGLCYNIPQMSVQTLVYNTTYLEKSYFNEPSSMNSTNTNLDEELSNFQTSVVSHLSQSILQEKLSEMSKTEKWLGLANYEMSMIAQDELLKKFFETYENALNIVWWRNLRLGNWKRFQNTLTNYGHNNRFELYLGTSGVVQYPSENKCDKEKYLELNLGFRNETVPSYIWTYLKSTDKALNTDFVVVGFNSPYAEYFTTDKIIFCPDICSQIPWLKEISTSFRYAYAGIMFCCSTDFIRQTNYLHGFPIEMLQPEQVATTSESATAVDYFPTETEEDISNLVRLIESENE